ncbi:twin transmembrane helix small protein [Rhodophyticola porphyridii]|uniref:Twin transmembrane helix small protein n=1 Tax=Rhodophyticola porphyridii TaxID=1852017 RepID=A0A3L9Y3T4_9RHOB|nr:twin transmembrane helix small protein [Rhodophyticola porphyridii]RMA40766.1 twin transmembrane helix small protein [Rhodophyticola porphyridii]
MLSDPLFILVTLACFGVLVVLLMGINSFRIGGEYNRKNANKFMRWRLLAQFVAVLLILVFVLFRRQAGG